MENQEQDTFFEAGNDESFQFELKEPVEKDGNMLHTEGSSESSSEKDGETSEQGRLKHTKAQTFAEFFKKEPIIESPSLEVADPSPTFTDISDSMDTDTSEGDDGRSNDNDVVVEPEIPEEENTQEVTEPEMEVRETEMTEAEEDLVEMEDVAREETEIRDVSYLTDMFRENDEYYTQMRIYIVQNKDTIETIADRYQVSIGQITKRNRLEDDSVSSGQILFIPYKKNT